MKKHFEFWDLHRQPGQSLTSVNGSPLGFELVRRPRLLGPMFVWEPTAWVALTSLCSGKEEAIPEARTALALLTYN